MTLAANDWPPIWHINSIFAWYLVIEYITTNTSYNQICIKMIGLEEISWKMVAINETIIGPYENFVPPTSLCGVTLWLCRHLFV